MGPERANPLPPGGAFRAQILFGTGIFVAPATPFVPPAGPNAEGSIDPSHGRIHRKRVRAREIEMKKLLLIAMAASTFVLAACNTVEGAGRDLQSAGRAIEDAGDR